MASIGASCAGVYVMHKRQIEKMERKEAEERAKRGETKDEDIQTNKVSGGGGRSKKVHPGNYPAAGAARNQGRTEE